MNSSKGNFLDRFNGKIGFITKHGDLISRSSFDERTQSKLPIDNGFCMNSHKIPKPYQPFGKQNQQKQNLTLSRKLERSQADSLYSKYNGGTSKIERVQKTGGKRSDMKQKLVSVGANSLDYDLLKGTNRHQSQKSSLSWEIKDQETKDFYQELTNLQVSKALSFNHNPKVHL